MTWSVKRGMDVLCSLVPITDDMDFVVLNIAYGIYVVVFGRLQAKSASESYLEWSF